MALFGDKRGIGSCGLSVASLIFCVVNALFVAKYSSRLTAWWPAVTVAYLLMTSLVIGWLQHSQHMFRGRKVLLSLTFCLFALAFLIIHLSIDPMTLKVDRWSAIHNFLSYLLVGKYPYMATTHLGGYGSPFPAWQLFHLPFYLIGDVGLSLLACLGLFTWVVDKYWDESKALRCLLLFVFSPSVWYEVAVRSDILANFLLVAVWCCWLMRIKDYGKRWCVISLVTGLFLSTRLNTFFPIAIALFHPYLQLNWQRKLGSVVLVLLTFALTFLPFFLWDGNQLFFFEYNPFVLQSRQVNIVDFQLFVPMLWWLSFKWSKVNEMHRNVAVMLCLLVVVTFAHNMIASGNYKLFSSTYDITYLTTAIPFAVLSMVLSKEDR